MKKVVLTFIIISSFLICYHDTNAAEPVRILLVPGHDDEVWGSQYGNTKEADMTLALATQLFNLLKKDDRFEVYITREKGSYTQEFKDYLADKRAEIIAFEKQAKQTIQASISAGNFVPKEGVPHQKVNSDVAIRLYGISKWANDNKMDAVIHIHFNDYARKTKWTPGKYRGFAIYVPDTQFGNAVASTDLAANIFMKLETKYMRSTYEKEKGGIIPDQKLIALGSNGTLLPTVRSVLIEYGYIYRYGSKSSRERNYPIMAKLTAAGIKNYFFPKP